MNNAQEIVKNVNFLSQLLTSNPYTAEGQSILKGLKINLTTSQFFEEKLYAEPFFLKNQSPVTSTADPTEENDEDDMLDKEDYIFVSDDDSNFKNLIMKSYETFQNSFNNLYELPLLFVRGGSGTGKSTYMYCLIHDLLKKNSEVVHTEFTLEEYTEGTFYGITIPIDSNSTMTRFIRIILSKIISIFDDEIDNALKSQNYDRINFAFCYYIENFMDLPSENQFNISVFEAFSDLYTLKSNHLKYKKNIVKNCLGYFTDSPSNSKILGDLLMLLFEVVFCLNSTKFNLISFDGIEYLINRTFHIYDSDINEIILTFEKTKQRAERLFKEGKFEFANKFKLILAIRNATLDYCTKREQENIRDSAMSVDVTNWYRIEDIYKAKTNYFSMQNYICENDFNKIKDIVEIVIKDSKKGKKRASGAMDMLERMYNFDKRSLQNNLLKAVSEIALGADGGILKEKFIELYDNVGPMVYNSTLRGHRFRYLCRRAIIRLLLNQIEFENRNTFFDGIYFSEYGEECMQSSYMRKLLIFLMHNQVTDNKISDNFVLLDDVINAIARPNGNSEIDELAFEQIVILIYRLSDFKLHNSAWQQLISIKVNFSNKQFLTDEKKFVSKIKELYYSHKLSKNDFGVKLNYASAFLAYIQSDFEFFACRCKKFKVPLIFSNDVNYIKSTLDAVHSKAINCIKMVIEDELDTFGDYKEMHDPEKKISL